MNMNISELSSKSCNFIIKQLIGEKSVLVEGIVDTEQIPLGNLLILVI